MKKRIVFALIIGIFITMFINLHIGERPSSGIVIMEIDRNGDIYYIEEKEEGYSLGKMNREGNIYFIKFIQSKKGVLYSTFNDLAVDDNGYIYLQAQEMMGSTYIRSYISVFNEKGIKQSELLEIDQTEGNGNLSFYGIDYAEGLLRVFIIGDDTKIKLLNYDPKTMEKWYVSYDFKSPIDVSQVVFAGKDNIYFSDKHSNVYHISADNELVNLELEGDIVPFHFSAKNYQGDLYFTDIHNFRFMKYDLEKDKIEVIFNENDEIFEGVQFNEVRNMCYDNETLTAYTLSYMEKDIVFIEGDGYANTFEYRVHNLNKVMVGSNSKVIRLTIFFIFIMVLAEIWFKRRNLILRVIIFMIGAFLIATISIIGFFDALIGDAIEQEIFEQLFSYSNIIAYNIDGDELKTINFPQTSQDEYYQKINKTLNIDFKSFYDALAASLDREYYYTVYYIEDDIIYVGFDVILDGDSGQTYISGTRKEYMSENVSDIENVKLDKVFLNSTSDALGEKMHCTTGIWDSNGEIVGYVEVGANLNVVSRSLELFRYIITAIVAFIMIVIIIFVVIILTRFFRGIKQLKTGVEEIINGNWDATVNISTNDEIEDIGNDFNRMTYRIKKYLESIVNLNTAFEKFIPSELFHMIDKENILDVNLGDQKRKNINILSVSTKNFFEMSKTMSTEENFKFINTLFGMMSSNIKKTGGVVESCQGAGLRAIYPDETGNAVDGALAIIGKQHSINRREGININYSLILMNSDAMIGIVGDNSRMTTTLVTEGLNSLYTLKVICEKNNISLLVTGDAYNKITRPEKYNFRYIGKIKDTINKDISIEMYDCLDAYLIEEKEKRLITKNEFEKGVNLFIDGNFAEARKNFINVIRIDATDEMTKEYILLCDKHLNSNTIGWEGVIMK